MKSPISPKAGGDAMAEQLARAKALRTKKPAPKKTESGEFPAVKADGEK